MTNDINSPMGPGLELSCRAPFGSADGCHGTGPKPCALHVVNGTGYAKGAAVLCARVELGTQAVPCGPRSRIFDSKHGIQERPS
jgi:hypothetical protein